MARQDSESEEGDVLGWITLASLWAIAAIFVVAIKYFYPNLIPFGFFELWEKSNVFGGVASSWPIFAWGIAGTIGFGLYALFFSKKWEFVERSYPWDILRSFFAGLLEEATFRWMFFFALIAVVAGVDFVTFGLVRWIYVHIEVPVVDFVTFGKMDWIFYWKGSWLVGAAALNANGQFRRAHVGFLQKINAWVVGLFLFYILANYGILAAMASHALYDVIVFTGYRLAEAISEI